MTPYFTSITRIVGALAFSVATVCSSQNLFAAANRQQATLESLINERSPEEHWKVAVSSLEDGNLQIAIQQLRIVAFAFPNCEWADEALFRLGAAYHDTGDLVKADDMLSRYLSKVTNPGHFEEVFQRKFTIAEEYRQGKKKHLFDSKRMPMWASGLDDAMELYEEISASLPSSDLAADALFSKGLILAGKGENTEAIDCFHTLILRFPKHSKVPLAYLEVAKLYLEKSKNEPNNPDLIGLAQVNLRKFRNSFPRDEHLLAAEHCLDQMKEVFAQGLYDTGQFYERTRKPLASAIYYRNVVRDYPLTQAAERSRDRLVQLRLDTDLASVREAG